MARTVHASMLTSISSEENNVSQCLPPDAPTARTGRGPVRRAEDRLLAGTNAGRSPTSTAAAAFARHLAGRGVTAGDRVAVMTSNRVEFLVAVNGISKLGAAAVLLSPPGRRRGRLHDALDRPPPRRGRGRRAPAGRARRRRRVTDLDDPATAAEAIAALSTDPVRADVGEADEAILVFSSGTTGLPRGRAPHPPMAAAPPPTGSALGLGPDDRFQVATPPSHILELLNLLAATEAGATVQLHRRSTSKRCCAIEAERMTLEMAVAPIALALANHPDLEATTSRRCATSCGAPPR